MQTSVQAPTHIERPAPQHFGQTRIYISRKPFKIGDTFLWGRSRWRVIYEYPAKQFLEDRAAYCVERAV